MPAKGSKDDSYRSFSEALKAGNIGSFYIFHGEERYLLEHMLAQLRLRLCPNGLDSFDYKRYDGKSLTLDELDKAIDALPSRAERTFVEIHDYDIFASEDKPRLGKMLSDLPGYVCVLFVYDIIPYKPDRRVKANTEILKCAQAVEFAVQEQSKLVKWIMLHYKDAGKTISADDAKYLAFITGGYMSTLHGEIEKTAAYAGGKTVTRADIDAVVTPILDAVAYKLTDAVARQDYTIAMRIMDELFQMREAPHKLLFSISLKMRQLLAARICVENKSGTNALISICGIKHEFQARALMDTARKTSLARCRNAVLHCADTAYELNSSPEPEARLTELLVKLAHT
ncbi:MAG: DNA polymerase III subunit delta [Oscillospiraceae bacterium]|nr:DNA polymerase III subunit delta [Oscillospiraceae bacterium]